MCWPGVCSGNFFVLVSSIQYTGQAYVQPRPMCWSHVLARPMCWSHMLARPMCWLGLYAPQAYVLASPCGGSGPMCWPGIFAGQAYVVARPMWWPGLQYVVARFMWWMYPPDLDCVFPHYFCRAMHCISWNFLLRTNNSQTSISVVYCMIGWLICLSFWLAGRFAEICDWMVDMLRFMIGRWDVLTFVIGWRICLSLCLTGGFLWLAGVNV